MTSPVTCKLGSFSNVVAVTTNQKPLENFFDSYLFCLQVFKDFWTVTNLFWDSFLSCCYLAFCIGFLSKIDFELNCF
jgi:hypothetical protein